MSETTAVRGGRARRLTGSRPAVLIVAVLCGSLHAGDVALSEVMYHPVDPQLEFIEIYNTTNAPVDLTDWSFRDGVEFTFPPGARIEPLSRVLICRDRTSLLAATGLDPAGVLGDFTGALENSGERLALFDRAGNEVDAFAYSDAPPFDPRADGGGPSLERLCFERPATLPGNWVASTADGGTPRAPNSARVCPPPLPRAYSPVVVSEIHYHPPGAADPDEEFVELHNRTDVGIDLHSWRLGGGIDHVFNRAAGPADIPPRGYLLVASNPAALAARTGLPAGQIAGPFAGRLSNFADDVELQLPDGTPLDRVAYAEDGVWPARADGLGASLQLIDPEISSALPQNWSVSWEATCSSRDGCVLVSNGMSVRWFESLDGTDPGFTGALDWVDPDFDDVANGWQDGRLAVGYDSRVPDGQPWVLTPSSANDGLHSILLRVEFDFDPASLDCPTDALYLGIDRDDGFVAWLNGVEIARGGMPETPGVVPPFDGTYAADIVTAGGFREDQPVYEGVWQATVDALRPGRNVLAIGNYNSRATSSDLYLSARLSIGTSVASGEFSPGTASTVGGSVVPPLIPWASHEPAEPRSSDEVRITARIDGPTIAEARVVFDSGSGETSASMRDDGLGGDMTAGDGIYSAMLPASPDDTLVRYRVEATVDDPGDCAAGRYPREGNPAAWTGYYVSDTRPETTEDVRLFYIFTLGALGDLSCSDGAWRDGAFVDFRGRAYFNVGVKFRGETACNYPKRPMRVRFNRGDTFDGQSRLNFNAGWNDKAMLREKLGFEFFRDAGVPYSETHLARVHTVGGRFHGAYFTIEDPRSEYLRRNDWESGRPLYKCRTPILNGSTSGYEPRTDEAEERIDEVGAFGAAINSLSGQALIDYLDAHLDVETMIDYQAVQVIIIDGDSVVKNWLLYLGPHGRAKSGPDLVSCFAWDIDLSHGQMYLTEDVRHHNIHPLFQTQTYPFVGQGHHGIVHALLQRAPDDYYVKAYYGRMWTLLQEKFHPDVFLAKLDRYDAATIETARDDLARWPRTWGSRGNDPDFWRDDLRAWAQRRYEYLTSYLLGDNPTTGGRRFQYTPAPRLRFTEIHYNPDGNEELEFVEIRNLEERAVDLSGWSVPAVEYEFPVASEIAAGGLIVLAKNPVVLRGLHAIPPAVTVFGPYPGNLRNGGEQLRLRDNGLYRGKVYYPETIDLVDYDDDAPWPGSADGEGRSLELISTSLDNDLASAWRASGATDGTPGTAPSGGNTAPTLRLSVFPTQGTAPLRVTFDASDSNDPEGDLFTVRWTFGDGFIGVGPQVVHTYAAPGSYTVEVTLDAESGPSASDTVEIEVDAAEPATRFVRGDVDGDREIDVSDPLRLLFRLAGEAAIDCDRAADADDDGRLQTTDAVYLLNFLFLVGPAPRDPFPACGVDASGDGPSCVSYPPCD